MKCLNKSLPLVQDLLKVIPNEGAVAILFDRLGENATYEQIVAENQRLTQEAIRATPSIKPGVEELFQENPEVIEGDLEIKDVFYDLNLNGRKFKSEELIDKENEILLDESRDYVDSITDISINSYDDRDTEVVLIIKPLALELNKLGLIESFIRDNADIIEQEEVYVDSYKISQHYKQFKDESFFSDLVEYYTGKKVIVYRLKVNKKAISEIRQKIGHSSNFITDNTSLRYKLVGDKFFEIKDKFGVVDNGIHFSDSKEEGKREASVWFGIPKIFTNNINAVKAHKYLWLQLRKVDKSVTFSGGTLDGTEIMSKPTDLDYRITTNDLEGTLEKILKLIPESSLDRTGIDETSGKKYYKLEYNFEDGKADIAIVPKEGYLGRVSGNHLAALMSDSWKTKVAAEKEKYYQLYESAKTAYGKTSKEALEAKNNYEFIKDKFRKQVYEWFGTSKITRTLEEQYKVSEIGNKEFNEFMDTIAEMFPQDVIRVVKAPLKSVKSLNLKAELKLRGRVYKARDIVRGTLVINNDLKEDSLSYIFSLLKSKFPHFKVDDYFKYPKLGYRGMNIDLLTNNDGVIELQINTPTMIYLKETKEVSKQILGDDLFEKLDKKYNGVGGKGHRIYDLMKEAKLRKNTARLKKLEQLSINYYGKNFTNPSAMFQLEEVPTSVASPETVSKVKKLLEKMGVSIKDLATYVKEAGLTNVKGVNGVADLTRRIIAIAEGKEDAAIVEEMVHIATAIIEQKNPNLVTEMISKIDRFKIYKVVFEQYKNNPAYQLPNGKPNIRKIKKEAVDKLIAEVIVNDNENIDQYPELREEENQSLVRRMWNAILDFFRKEYRKADISIFEEAAALITEGEIGTAAEIKEGGVYFQITDVQNKVQSKILETDNRIVKVEEKEKEADPLLMDTEEAKSFYKYKKPDGTWETIKKRVTDRVKEWYRERFGKKQFSKQEKAFNEIKRKFGVQGHADLQEIHSRYYHTEKDEKYGTRREKPLSRPTKFNLPSDDMYEKLEAYFVELMDTFPPGTMIFSEVLVYDPREKEAGTLDFLAVEPSGKGHILDWKFMHIKGDDVAWFKNGAFNIQLTRYREIARDTLGIKEFGMTRAIPIAMKFEPKNQKDVTQGYDLKGIAIGAVNPDLIKEIKLLPIASELESTGYDELDKLIRKLNKLLEQYSKEKVKDESAREFKLEKLNTLRLAIRRAQATQDVAPLLDVIELTMQEGQEILNDYNAIYKNAPSTTSDFKNKDLSAFSDRMNNFISTSEIFVNTARDLREIIYKEGSEEKAKTKEEKEDAAARKKLYNQLSKASDSIYYSQRNITDAALNFADKHIGEKYLVFGLLRPEPIVKSIASWFRGASEIGIKSIELLSKLTADAQSRGAADAFEEIKDLMSIRERFAKRGNIRELARKVYQVNEKGERVNKLVFKYKKDFNDILDKMVDGGGDMNWIKENIDVEEYKKEAEKEIERRAKYIEEHRYSPDDAENEDIKRRELDRINRMFDLEHKKFDGWNNYILKRHGLSKWYSDQYKEVEKDSDLFALYSFIQKFNEKAKDVGYIENNITKNFIPFIRKGMAEELAWDGSISAVARWNQSLKLNPDDVGYGEFNEITGELENSIPRYYTYDFTYKDGVNDYSDVSEDIFKNMILYIQQVEKYKYLVDVEGMLKLLKTVEQFKANIRTDRINNVVRKDGKVSEIENNFDNAKMYDDFMRVMLYEQKYVLSDKDVPLYGGKVINYFKDAVNTITGREVWKKNETPSATSLHKTMDAANKALQLKSLGLDFIPGAINWFGGNLQMLAQVGTYFNIKDFTKNESYLTKQFVKERFVNDEEKETFIQLLNTFMPLKDDPSYDLYKSAGMSALTRGNLTDTLFVFMREPEILLEKTVFLSLLDNTMVEDGKVVNIQEFVKKKYKNRYDSSAKYKEAAPKIEQEIAELKKKRSISAIKKLENGKLVIPGLDLTNRDELQRLTNLSRDISSKITGSMTRQQVNRASQSIWMKSMMVFRGWIPKLADTRFGEFRRISDDFSVRLNEEGLVEGQKYDIGRIRLLLYVLNDGFYKGFANINNILAVNDAGLERLDEMFEDFRQKFEDETGEVLNMTREDFIDLIRTNLRNEIRELLILGILLGSMLSLGFIAPDDDDDKAAKNKHRYAERVVGRFVDELSFFYNPSQWSETLAGGIFPATGLISDFTRFLRHFTMEITGIDFDPKTSYEDVHKKAQPVKHLMKMFPVTKSAVTYLGIFSDEFAREFDITIQKETNR